jgi:tubulin polyglutamylase TTLL9
MRHQVAEADPGPWDLYWCDTTWARETYGKGSLVLPEHARICHFPQHFELTRKDFMAKNLKAFRRLAEREPVPHQHLLDVSFSFVPETFWLPHDYGMFVESFKRQPGSVWIMKPAGSAQGRGIFLIRKLSEVLAFRKDHRFPVAGAPQDKPDQAYIVQRYLERPYLIGGKKFDLRLYVLVTSYQPLVAWVYREGFARFSGFPYSLEDIGNSQVHLTNVAVQKKAEGYDKSKGCKWLMTQLRRFIAARHSEQAAEEMLTLIYRLFLTSLHAVQPRVAKDPRCFELYGFDVLLDADLKPHLIEVNASPALTADTPTDYALKRALLEDTFHIVDVLRR